MHALSGIFTIGPLGPCPPFELAKNLHMAKSATLEKLPQFFEILCANLQENH